MPLEMMIEKSDCIITGTVQEKTRMETTNHEQFELFSINVNRTIMSKTVLPDNIIVRVFSGSTLYDQIVINNFRPKLSKNEEVILFLRLCP